MRIPDADLQRFINEVRKRGIVDQQLAHYQTLMLYYTIHPEEAREDTICALNQIFKALLAEKARQEAIEKMCYDYSPHTQHGGTRPTNDPSRRIRIRDILQQKIAWS
jgi:hypothetical protein